MKNKIQTTLFILLFITVGAMNAQAQYRYNSQPDKLDNQLGIGASLDGQGTIGVISYIEEWMLEFMSKTEYQGNTDIDYNSYKLGRAFPIVRTTSVNFSLFGMGGYASYKEDSGSFEEKTSGMILEAGGLLSFKAIGLGASYVALDEAYEEEYVNFKLIIFMGMF